MPHDDLTTIADVLGHDLPSIDRAFSRSLIDADFRKRLLDDAKAAFAEEGVVFPDGVSATCHVVDLNDRHFFLPPMVSDPTPVNAADAPQDRPGLAPEDLPVEGGVRPGVARPFMLGQRYPGPPPNIDEPDQRW